MTTDPASPTKGPRKPVLNPGGLPVFLFAIFLLLLPIGFLLSWDPENPPAVGHVVLDQMKEIEKSLHFHRLDTGEWPECLEDLTRHSEEFGEPWIRSIPRDPWEESYVYRATPGSGVFELFSKGPDREAGTGDDVVLPSR